MAKLRDLIKKLFKPRQKRRLTPEEKQATDEQIIIIDNITRGSS